MSVEDRPQLSLDDLYHMTAFIYSEQNAGRTREATFSHFVEVCGMLSSIERSKPRGEIDIVEALCKSLAWFFPLVAQFGISSIQNLLFRKYPLVCPYCRKEQHSDRDCKSTRGIASPGILNHEDLKRLSTSNLPRQPRSLNQWQEMFSTIYPRSRDDGSGRNTLGLTEEIGELAEAIRVFEREPRYFVGEAADVFSYLMGFANSYTNTLARETGQDFDFDAEYIKHYPGLCTACGYPQCRCPHLPEATIGRMAKELTLEDENQIFYSKIGNNLAHDGSEVSKRVFENIGGYPGLLNLFPFDRGQANHDVVEVTILAANAVRDQHPTIADSLMRNALRLRQAETSAGKRVRSDEAADAYAEIQTLLSRPDVNDQISNLEIRDNNLAKGTIPRPITILLISSSANGRPEIDTNEEIRLVKESIKKSDDRNRLNPLEPLLAARIDDIALALEENDVHVVHFAGHGDEQGICLRSDDGENTTMWSYVNLCEFLVRNGRAECIVLNACDADSGDWSKFPGVVIATKGDVDDRATIQFSRSFYQTLGAGSNYVRAATLAEVTTKSKGFDDFSVSIKEPAKSS